MKAAIYARRSIKKRPRLQALLAAEERHEFQKLVVAEQKVLGRGNGRDLLPHQEARD